jgi:hypothetical protein
MNHSILTAIASALAVAAPVAAAQGDQIGDAYEITMIRESARESGDRSSGSSYDKDTIIEHVIAIRPDGLELEYDLPNEATSDERAGNWQFPARLFRSDNGTFKLLNGAELETRLSNWLKSAGWTRTVCGHWIFTWNAFRIECDPQSVIETVRAFDMRVSALSDGGSYSENDTRGVGTLRRQAAGPNGAAFLVELAVDADAVRRARAESDVAVGEIMQKPVTLDAALLERAKQSVTGSITIKFETDAAGKLARKTKVTKLATEEKNGRVERETITQTLERRRFGDSKS